MKLLYVFICFAICINSGVLCVNYIEDYFDQILDHFNFVTHGNNSYKQRYLYNDTWWDGKGPIFFYAGNEGDIVNFWDNSGFIFDIAPSFNALVVFAEHRYYGKSLPFGEKSFDGQNIGLLSITQALADYAFFLKSFKIKQKIEDVPVIAFGGSYGGMLAAYMRFKYPNIVSGAVAASAPIYLVAGMYSGEDRFFNAITKDFRDINPKCEVQVRRAFSLLKTWSTLGQAGYQKISTNFHLCNVLKTNVDYEHLLLWIRNAFVSAAMGDYPYPTSFMGKFPAFPVKVMCNLLLANDPITGLFEASALFYNSSGTLECFNIYDEYIYCSDPTGCGLGDDSKAWDYQACTEINLEGGSNGITDMFPDLPFNSSMRDEYCAKTWNVQPRRNWLDTIFWGENIETATNIVFSNGDLDPWGPGGVTKNISDSVVSVLITGGAHHLDLRGQNPADPPSVIAARKFEAENIKKWLNAKK